MLWLVATVSGCCATSQTIRVPLPANRPEKPSPRQVFGMSRIEVEAELVKAWKYIEAMEREPVWLDD